MTKQEVAPRDGDMRFVQLERELRANEDRWDAVLANPFMGITVLDKNQYFIATNSTFQAMVGYTDDELKKITPLDITPANERETNRMLFSELQQGKRQHFELVKAAPAERWPADLDTALCFSDCGSGGDRPAHFWHEF